MTADDSMWESAQTAVLEALRQGGGEWRAARALADRAGIGLPHVGGVVDLLLRSGYVVEHHPRLGYRLVGASDRLAPYEVSRGLRTAVIGRELLAFDRVESTNDVAWGRASMGAPDGAVYFAEEQTAGRGRMGRRWWCPKGKGLLFSVVLRPEIDVFRQPVLTTMSAVAVAKAVQETYALPVLIRWPNDILVRGRKAGGILVEARKMGGAAVFVLGIGVNTSTRVDEFPEEIGQAATSLSVETSRQVDRVECARAVLRSLDRWYAVLRAEDCGKIAREWRSMSSTLGRRVTLADSQAEYSGRVLDLSLEDGLILRLDSGVTRVFPPGRFTLTREAGVQLPGFGPPASA